MVTLEITVGLMGQIFLYSSEIGVGQGGDVWALTSPSTLGNICSSADGHALVLWFYASLCHLFAIWLQVNSLILLGPYFLTIKMKE